MKDHVEIGHLTKYDACKYDLTKCDERMMKYDYVWLSMMNVIIQSMHALLDKATSYIRLLWGLRSHKDLSIIMVALFLTNYLNGISCLHIF